MVLEKLHKNQKSVQSSLQTLQSKSLRNEHFFVKLSY